MNIFYPTTIRPTGGSSTFARYWQKFCADQGHRVYFTRPARYDLLFVNAFCHPRYLLEAKIYRRPIVQRLDGVFYPTSRAGHWWPWHNLPLRVVYRWLADYTIFQSKYSRKVARHYLGRAHANRESVIYNGVDTNHFSNRGARPLRERHPGQTIFITHSRFRLKSQVEPILAAFSVYQQKYEAGAHLYLLGDFAPPLQGLPRRLKSNKQIHLPGIVTHDKLPAYLRSADVFLFTHLNPPCPNNVLEAMACGTPIGGLREGAMAELTTPNRNSKLMPTGLDSHSKERLFDPKVFAHNMYQLKQNKESFGRASRAIACQRFSLTSALRQYLAVLESLVN